MTYEIGDSGADVPLRDVNAGYDRIMRNASSLDGAAFSDDASWMTRVSVCTRAFEACVKESQRNWSSELMSVHEYGYAVARERLYAATAWMLAGADREDRLDDPNTMALVRCLKDHVPSRAVDHMACRSTTRLLTRSRELLVAGDDAGIARLVETHRRNTSLRQCADMTMATLEGRDRTISEMLVNCAASPLASRELLESIIVPILAPDPPKGRRHFELVQAIDGNDADVTFLAAVNNILDLVRTDQGALRLDYRDVGRLFVAIEGLTVTLPRAKKAPVFDAMTSTLRTTRDVLLSEASPGLIDATTAGAWGDVLSTTFTKSDVYRGDATDYGVETMKQYAAALQDDLAGALAGAGAFLSAFRQPLIGSRNAEWLQVHSEMVRTLVGQGVGLDTSLMATLSANVVANQSIYKDRDLVRFIASSVALTTDLDDVHELLTVNRAESVSQLAVQLSTFDAPASLDLLARAVKELDADEIVGLMGSLKSLGPVPGVVRLTDESFGGSPVVDSHPLGQMVADRVSAPIAIGRAYRISVELDRVDSSRIAQALEFKELLRSMPLLDVFSALEGLVGDLDVIHVGGDRWVAESQRWLETIETWVGEPGADDPRNDAVLAALSLVDCVQSSPGNASLALLCLERAGVLGRPEADWIALRSLDYLSGLDNTSEDEVVNLVYSAYREHGRGDVALRAVLHQFKGTSRYFYQRSMFKICADVLSERLLRPTVEPACLQAWYYLASSNDPDVSNFVSEPQIHDYAALLGQGLLGFADLGDELHNTGSVELRDEIAGLVSDSLFLSAQKGHRELAGQLNGQIALYKSRQVSSR